MQKGRTTSFPSRIVTIAARSTAQPGKAPNISVERIDAIVSRHSRIEAGQNGRIKTFVGQSGAEWLLWLKERLRHEGVTWIIAHRMGDLLRRIGFFAMIDDGSITLTPPSSAPVILDRSGKPIKPPNPLVLAADLPTAIKVFTETGQKMILCDLRNWIDCDLNDLASSLGIDRITTPENSADVVGHDAALIRDLEIQETAFLAYLAWVKSRGINDFRLTAGAQSMSLYKIRHRKITPTDDAEEDAAKLTRMGLWGGKVVARFVGHCKVNGALSEEGTTTPDGPVEGKTPGGLYHLDVTGLYASLMQRREFPHQLIEWNDSPSEPDHGPPYFGRDLVASVLIKTDKDTYPVKDGRRTIFATGSYWTTLAGPELARAIRHGCVRGWGLYARYKLANLFESYIDELWKLRDHARKSGNLMFSRIAKVFINSLWGKFAARTPLWTEADDPGFGEQWGVFPLVDNDAGTIEWYRALAGVYQVQSKPEDSPDAYPAISAWLTSYGRVFLDDLVSIAGDRDVLYVAVDALVTGERGYLNLCIAGQCEPDRLGKLRVTGRHHLGNFGGYNRYWLDGVRHVSGLKADSAEIRPGVYRQADGGKLVPALLAGERDGLVSVTRTVDFSRNVVYGHVAPDGWVTPPEIVQVPF